MDSSGLQAIFVSMSAGRVTQLRPYIRPVMRSLVISGPDGFPRVFIPITLAVLMTYGQSGLRKHRSDRVAIVVKKALQRGGRTR